jgi:ubiquinone/menaquinone biosynthesis C-methylase UbiE
VPQTSGRVLHWAARYDLLMWVLTLGREQRFREKLLRLARLQRGESVLDVGCGTGSLAIAAKRYVGSAGKVCAIDASPEMIARAKRKAARARLDVTFDEAIAEVLPFPDAHFDVVLNTAMLHHLPKDARAQCAREMRRVLKPNGRVLAVDFVNAWRKHGFLGHFHGRGQPSAADIVALLAAAGLNSVASGTVGPRSLQYVLGTPFLKP